MYSLPRRRRGREYADTRKAVVLEKSNFYVFSLLPMAGKKIRGYPESGCFGKKE